MLPINNLMVDSHVAHGKSRDGSGNDCASPLPSGRASQRSPSPPQCPVKRRGCRNKRHRSGRRSMSTRVDMEDAAIGARILSTRYTSSTDFEHACVLSFRFGISEKCGRSLSVAVINPNGKGANSRLCYFATSWMLVVPFVVTRRRLCFRQNPTVQTSTFSAGWSAGLSCRDRGVRARWRPPSSTDAPPLRPMMSPLAGGDAWPGDATASARVA